MKLKALLILLIIGFSINLYSQSVEESLVPDAVKKSFQNKFKSTSTPDWTMENGVYSVDFYNGDFKGTASFNKDGSFEKSDVEIDLASTPEVIKSYVSTNFNGLKIDHVRQILSKNKEENNYYINASKILADKKKHDAEFTVTEDGKLISENVPGELQVYRNKGGAAVKKTGPQTSKPTTKPTTTANKTAPTKQPAKQTADKKEAKEKKSAPTTDGSIPETVTDHFLKMFKQPGEVKWDDNDDAYVANFSFKGQKSKAFYTKDGNYDKFQSEVSPSAAPPTVQKTLTTNYKDYKVISIANTITADKQKFYEIQLAEKNDKQKKIAKTVRTNMTGQVTKETVVGGSNEEEENNEVAANTIPDVVKKSFVVKYAKVLDAKWEKIETNYVASFFFKGDKNEAEYDEYGNWLRTTKYLPFAKLPPPVQKFITDKYKGEKILKSQYVETLDKQKYFYVETKTEAKKKSVAKINKIKMNAAGKPLEQLTEDEDASEVPFQPAVEEQPKQSKPEKVKAEKKEKVKPEEKPKAEKKEKVKPEEKPKAEKKEKVMPEEKPNQVKEEKVKKEEPVKKPEPVMTPEQEEKARKKAIEEQKKLDEKAKKEEEKRLKKKQKEDAEIEKELEKEGKDK
jgi:hypothetical protein